MTKINVKTGTEYNVLIGENLLNDTGTLVSEVKTPCKAAIISDDKVYSLYGKVVENSLEKCGFEVVSYYFENGEKSKNLATFSNILEFLAESKLTRTDIIIALGGGVVGDMAGFCASVYLRGIDFVQIPTTLLAAVDSSVGGKTAIDLEHGKNLAGAFHQPILVICDTKAFDTLDSRQISCGMAEVIKYGIICDKELFEMLENDDTPEYTALSARCISIKRDIVEKDEFEHGDRKLLNLGHTLGHAVEKHSAFTLTHGEAVAVGMMMISVIAEKHGYAKENISERLEKLLRKYGLTIKYNIAGKQLFNLATGDKKVSGGSITAVIPERIGKCLLEKMSLEEFRTLIDSSF